MLKPKKKITIEATDAQTRFLNFCEKFKYMEMRLLVMDGEPKKALQVVRSVRFDLPPDELSTIDSIDESDFVNVKFL